IDNAIKYNRPGGSVKVNASAASSPDANVAGRRPRGQVQGMWALIRVSDNGQGIPAAHLPRLSERFYRADKARVAGGSGLGLAIVQENVRAHNGQFRVESEEGKGTTASIWLPARADPPAH
ncbi:MAG: sensor histidine kinase, partial [Rudaea sp.]